MSSTDTKTDSKIFIAECALRLFVQKGYHSTSVPDIVAECGLSTGAVYHHFDSKESLARFIHEQASCEFIRRFDSLVILHKSFRDKLYAFVRMMFSWDDENPDMVKYLITDRPSEILNHKTTVCSAEGMKCVGEIVLQGLTSQEISVENYFVAISLISGTIIHFINLKKDGYIHGNLADRADEIAQHIYNSMKI